MDRGKVYAVPADKLEEALKSTRLASTDLTALRSAPRRGTVVHLTEAQIKKVGGVLAIKASSWPIVD